MTRSAIYSRIIVVTVAVILLIIAEASVSHASTAKLPQMTGQAARHYSIVALQRRFKQDFYLGGFRSRCDKRISRTRVRCSVSWFQGDWLFSGHTTIWYSFDKQARVWWNYSYDITRVDDYCYRVQRRSLKRCSRHYHVS